MPYDMQKIIMTGVMPAHYQDKNPSPFTTIPPKDEHRKKFKTMYGGLFTEVFEKMGFQLCLNEKPLPLFQLSNSFQ